MDYLKRGRLEPRLTSLVYIQGKKNPGVNRGFAFYGQAH